MIALHLGDCLEVLRALPDCSVHAVVTDPPYGLSEHKPAEVAACLRAWLAGEPYEPAARGGFMGRVWDAWVPGPEVWRECLRVLKPGGHMLVFAGTRTQDLMGMAVRLAGFEIRDSVHWVYSTGFPKSADVSKQLDAHEKKLWMDISKAVDGLDRSIIMDAWKKYLKTARNAGLSFLSISEKENATMPQESIALPSAPTKAFQDASRSCTKSESSNAMCAERIFRKNQTGIGTNTQKSGSVHWRVVLQVNPGNSDAGAVIAELSLSEARLTCAKMCSALTNVGNSEKHDLARYAESQPQKLDATCNLIGTVLFNVRELQSEHAADKLKAVEALKTWLGSKPSSRKEATCALCAALTDDLKLITLSQSKIFLSFDTIRQMACASAISATITESTAESLISFTAGILKNEALDKAAGAEREVLGPPRYSRGKTTQRYSATRRVSYDYDPQPITAPSTAHARQWQGYGTALKPAHEPVLLARKPIDGTVAQNILNHGCGGLNIDGCRVGVTKSVPWSLSKTKNQVYGNGLGGYRQDGTEAGHNPNIGRFPANLVHDGSAAVVGLFPQTADNPSCPIKRGKRSDDNIYGGQSNAQGTVGYGYSDSGTAARYFQTCPPDPEPDPLFYCPKASKRDRDEGLEERPEVFRANGNKWTDQDYRVARGERPQSAESGPRRNVHPCVKPVSLMRYLVRLVTPPGGTVLDPFMGSGSTGKAAALEGFAFIGIEREQEYLDIARARIEHAQRQAAEVVELADDQLELGGA